jgi:hypothetical protein
MDNRLTDSNVEMEQSGGIKFAYGTLPLLPPNHRTRLKNVIGYEGTACRRLKQHESQSFKSLSRKTRGVKENSVCDVEASVPISSTWHTLTPRPWSSAQRRAR